MEYLKQSLKYLFGAYRLIVNENKKVNIILMIVKMIRCLY